MTSVGDYDLEHQIGAGASGTVWKAHRRGPVPQVVALKRLRAGGDAAEVARIRREAAVLTDLDHPHVVRIHEVVHDGDGVALAMQFAPGGSLQDLLDRRGRLAPGEVVAVAAPVAEALASAHRRGVLHGDVKPANVLFTSDGEPLLTDFGVARTLDRVTSDQITGTAEYLAPELLDGARPDARADTYALAVVCYQALTGRLPYTGPTPLALVRAADVGRHERLDERGDVPAPLARAVEQAMARRPEERFATADEFARVLRTTVPAGEIRVPGPAAPPSHPAVRAGSSGPGRPSGGTGAALTTTFGPRPPRPEPPAPPAAPRRRRLPVAAALVGVLAIGGIALVRGPLASDDDADDPTCERPGSSIVIGGERVGGDVDGNGCVVTGTYQPQTLADGSTAMILSIELDGELRQIGLGEPGDQVVLGDWDCDGVDTPGLYRAAVGEVQYFNVWPTVVDQAYQPDATEQVATRGVAERTDGSGSRDGGDGGDGGDSGDSGDCDRMRVSGTGSTAT